MYETTHIEEKSSQMSIMNSTPKKGKINYTVWSDVFVCPTCGEEFVFWDVVNGVAFLIK
jgi:predicted RNA-binding Zn-ribbon protein involved in translation (DUF1610 family)